MDERVPEAEAASLTITGIRDQIRRVYGDQYTDERIAIVDAERKRSEDLPEKMIFMEYEGMANPTVYGAAIELIAKKPEMPPPGFKSSQNGRWFIWLKAEKINYDRLKEEIEHYNEILRSA